MLYAVYSSQPDGESLEALFLSKQDADTFFYNSAGRQCLRIERWKFIDKPDPRNECRLFENDGGYVYAGCYVPEEEPAMCLDGCHDCPCECDEE